MVRHAFITGASFLIDGGFGVQVRGGRWELSGALMVHGDPKIGGRGRGTVLISAVTGDDWFPISGARCGLFEPGELIGIRSDAEFLIQACEFQQDISDEKLTEDGVRIASNSGYDAELVWQANLGIPAPAATKEGRRKLVVGGQAKPLKIKPR